MRFNPEGFRMRYYDMDGNEIDHGRWMELFSRPRHVAEDFFHAEDVEGIIHVSTVWLGMDHGWIGGGADRKPIIFETMVFMDRAWLDETMRRYSTKEEAMAGHQEMIAELERMIGKDKLRKLEPPSTMEEMAEFDRLVEESHRPKHDGPSASE